MLRKFYEQGKDLHVANYMAYGKTADHKLYADAAFKESRLIVVEGENYLLPVAFGTTGVVTVTAGETVKTQAWTASDPA